MAIIVTDLHCDLTQNVKPQFLHGNLFSQDNAANTINVHVFNGGEPAALGGSISANVIRSDGATVAVSGAIDGNKAYIILPQACYAVPGVIKIIIKNTESTTVTTIAAVVANVYASSTDTVVDPGQIIPSVAALIAEIEAAVDSIPVDYSGLLATIAADYSSSKTYPIVGMYAWQGGVLKRNIVPITTAETYTAAHWTNAVLGDDVSALKSAFGVDSQVDKNGIGATIGARFAVWEQGYYYSTPAVGNTANLNLNANEIRACSLMPISAGEYLHWSGKGGGTNVNAAWAFLDSNNVVLAKAASDLTGERVIIAPENSAKVILNNYLTSGGEPIKDQYAFITSFNMPFYTLNNRIRQTASDWKVGYYSSGSYDSYNRAICTKNPLSIPYDCELAVIAPPGYHVDIYEFGSDDTYIGHYASISANVKEATNNIIHAVKGHKYHFAIGTFASGTAKNYLTQDFIDSFQVYTNMYNNSDQLYSVTSTGDNTDRTEEIMEILRTDGDCSLGPGTFYVSGIVMPDGSMISGCGKQTRIRLIDSEMENLWTQGDKTFTKGIQIVFDDFMPAGRYEITADVVTEDTGTTCRIDLYRSKTSFGTATRVGSGQIAHGEGKKVVIFASEPFVTVELMAASAWSLGEGEEATYSNISMIAENTAIIIGDSCTVKNVCIAGSDTEDVAVEDVPTEDLLRNGIGYYGAGSNTEKHMGIIDGCFIYGFEGGGIKLDNTGYSIKGLNISNCYMYANYCGLYNIHFSEFHRITNCNMFGNYIGAMCNGGNNQFTACNMSSNHYGFYMDSENDTHNNGAHGGVTGCIMQHNRINAVYIKYEQSGMVFTGCNIDNGGAYLEHATRIIFDGCNFMGEFGVEVIGGGLIMFANCNMRSYTSSHTSITDNDKVKFINCFDNNGNVIDPTA